MAPRWLKNEEADDEEKRRSSAEGDVKGIEIKPEMMAEAMKPHLDSFRTEFGATMDEKLKAVNEFFAAQTKEREAAARKKQQEDEHVDEPDYYADPAGAIDKKLQPLIRSQQAANALLMINETIGEMDYYKSDPEFKAKVLAKINAQPLALRANADIILNCYKLVAYDEREAIKEGKYKSVLGAASTNGTGGHSGTPTNKGEDVTISDEEKVYAKKMGISETDWVKSKKTLEYV
jgi:hypothetical protein